MKLSRYALALLPLSSTCFAQSPWLPIPGSTTATLSYVVQSADELFAGPMQARLPDDLEQRTTSLNIEHGLSDSIALFGTVGYAKSKFPPAGKNDSGLTDSRLGVAWRVVDEYAQQGWPTLTARANFIIEGNYEVGRIDAIGDGASGFELAASVGKDFGRVKLWGNLGLRERGSPVPSETFYDVNLGVGLFAGVSAQVGYAVQTSDGKLDIGGAGFSPARFPEVKEERDVLKFGVSWAINAQHALGLNYATVEDGRNTPISDVLGLAYSLSF